MATEGIQVSSDKAAGQFLTPVFWSIDCRTPDRAPLDQLVSRLFRYCLRCGQPLPTPPAEPARVAAQACSECGTVHYRSASPGASGLVTRADRVLEETGLDVRPTHLLGAFVDRYGAEGDYLLNMFYAVEIIGGELQQSNEVAELRWFHADALPDQIAFARARQVVRRQNLDRTQAARSYTWCRPLITGRDWIGPVTGRSDGSGVCSPRVRCGRSWL